MKAFKPIIFFIFSALFLYPNLFGIIVLLNGPTCSGKSSIAREFLGLVDQSEWVCVALDNIEDEGASDVRLVAALCNKVFQALRRNKNVICDTVFDNKKALQLFLKQFEQELIVKVFVHCPLLSLIRYLKLRNERAYLLIKEDEQRDIVSLINAFLNFYIPVKRRSRGLGPFSLSDIEIIFQGDQVVGLPKDIRKRLKSSLERLCCDIKRRDCHKLVYLAPKFGNYDIIVNSGKYSSKDCAQHILDEMRRRF